MNQSLAACGIISGNREAPKSMQKPGLGENLKISACVLLLILSACAGTGSAPRPEQGDAVSAESAFARGAYRQAAETWQQEALDAEPQQAAGKRVRAADSWLLAGEPDRAKNVLRWVNREELLPRDEARLDLVLADLALRSGRPDEAEALLRMAEPLLPSSSQQRYRNLYESVLHQLSSPGSREISQAAQMIGRMVAYDPATTLELIRSLDYVSSGELAIRANNPRGERQLTGWLDLALVIRRNLVIPDRITASIAEWKARHPYHLLTEQQALDTWLRYRQLFSAPHKVAVLLPESGSLKFAGEAIRDGFMSAYLDRPRSAEVLFFPTGGDDQSTIAAYFSALDAGVDLIIGPLRKESVAAMLLLAGMSTPVLALNQLPENFEAPAGLAGRIVGMSLSQEEEAAAAARRAVATNHRRAIVLVPESAWGERIALAFEAEFLHEDREIVAAARYQESENDHSAALERLLKIDESKARMRRLANTLQMTLEFEPTRRNDVDMIFLAANATQAKLIRPQLRFHEAGDIPVYTTGRVYTGQPDPARNQDLNGIRFPATPWHLAHSREGDIPGLASLRGGSLGALFALGQDAWNLLPWLELMQKDPDFRFPGRSGHYLSQAGGTLRREPAWAEFRNGKPVRLPDPPPVIHPSISGAEVAGN